MEEAEKVFSTRTASPEQHIKFSFGNKKVPDFEEVTKKNNELFLLEPKSIQCK